MQEAVTAAAETVCCVAQLTSAALLLTAHFMHSRTEADSQAVT